MPYIDTRHGRTRRQRDHLLPTPSNAGDFIGSPFPEPGARVRGVGGNPPWLVVDHYIERIEISRWPVRLWRVANVEAASREHQVSDWDTRAVSMEIVEELPTGLLFGEHGADVVRVIDAAQGLREIDVATLDDGRRESAGAIYREMWRRWTAQGRSGSPIGHALVLIHHGVDDAARRVGTQLFRYDPVDEVDVLSDRGWVAAKDALLETAVSLGAPDLANEVEREVLTAAWTHWKTS